MTTTQTSTYVLATANDVVVGDNVETRNARTGEYVRRGEVLEVRSVDNTHKVFLYAWGDEIIRNDNTVRIDS